MVEIRAVTPNDVDAVRALLGVTWHATYDAFMGAREVQAITDDWHASARLLQQCQVDGAPFVLATIDAAVVGTASAHRVSEQEVHLDRLYVHPQWQRRALGTQLLQAVDARLPAAVMRLEVDPRNRGAIAFYIRRGFVRGECVGDELTMERRTGPVTAPPG